jgi:hypothetical protein
MSIAIPVAPAGIILLLNFFAPYLVSIIQAPFWPKSAKKWVSIGVSLVLAAIVIVLYYALSGTPWPVSWPALLLFGVVVTQTSYSTILKDSADAVTSLSGTGSSIPAAIVSTVPTNVTTLPAGTLLTLAAATPISSGTSSDASTSSGPVS